MIADLGGLKEHPQGCLQAHPLKDGLADPPAVPLVPLDLLMAAKVCHGEGTCGLLSAQTCAAVPQDPLVLWVQWDLADVRHTQVREVLAVQTLTFPRVVLRPPSL